MDLKIFNVSEKFAKNENILYENINFLRVFHLFSLYTKNTTKYKKKHEPISDTQTFETRKNENFLHRIKTQKKSKIYIFSDIIIYLKKNPKNIYINYKF